MLPRQGLRPWLWNRSLFFSLWDRRRRPACSVILRGLKRPESFAIEPGASAAGRLAGARGAGWLGGILELLQVARAAETAHLREDPVTARHYIVRRRLHLEGDRIRQHGSQGRAFVPAQSRRRQAIEALACGFHAVDAITELRHVQIHLEYPFLRPGELDEQREIRFDTFARVEIGRASC